MSDKLSYTDLKGERITLRSFTPDCAEELLNYYIKKIT